MATKQVQCEGTRGKYYAIVLSYVKNSYNVETNKSNITLKGIIKSTNSSYSYYGFDNDGELSIKGDVVSGKKTTSYRSIKTGSKTSNVTTSGVTLVTWTGDVQHENNGNLSLSVKFNFDTSYSYLSATKAEVTWNLSQNRLATVTSASDFTDEENPTLEFTNPGGFNVYPYLNFYDDAGTKVHTLYRNSSSVASPYTWDITDAERTEIRKATNKQQKYKVNVGVETYNGTTYIGYSSKAQTMTYVNATPSESTVFAETNQKVIDILGTSNANTIIQNVSKIKLTSTPNVKKEATVTKINFEHNAISVEDKTSPYEYTFTPANSKFKVTITDSRNYSKANEYTKTIIEYATVNIDKCSFKRENPTSSNIILNAQIRYKQTTFGSKVNTPTIKWKLGESGTLHTLTSSEYTVDTSNKRITISNLVLSESLDYTSEARFYLYVNDLLTEDTENELVLRGIPTCDMGEHDFQVNGDLFVADINRENKVNILEQINFLKSQKVLWEGQFYMHGTQEIDLSETPISSQPNGIVLVFSAFSDGEAKDWDFKQFFISKKSVELIDGAGYDFILNTKDFGKVAGKYLYIYNDKITGHANNTATGTGTSGIKYTNNAWVLRYVIGV